MTRNVFPAPCDPGDFDRTVLSAVDVRDHPDRPSALADEDTVRFWDGRDGSDTRDYFEKMASGDLVLFYRDGTYIGTGWIGDTFTDEDRWAASAFWKNAPSELVYTIDDFVPISVPKERVNRVFDYVDHYNPQGLMRVAKNRVTNRPEAIKRALERYTEKHG